MFLWVRAWSLRARFPRWSSAFIQSGCPQRSGVPLIGGERTKKVREWSSRCISVLYRQRPHQGTPLMRSQSPEIGHGSVLSACQESTFCIPALWEAWEHIWEPTEPTQASGEMNL